MTYVSLRLKVLSILAVFSIFILAACSVPSSPQLFIAEKTMLVEVGEQRTLNFTTSFPLDDLTWTSSNPEVVSVVDGRITALKEGTSTIQVTADTGRIFDSVLITVSEPATTPEPPVEPEPEVPVVEEPEVPVVEEPDPEVPVVEEPGEDVSTPASIFTVTINNELGEIIQTLTLEEGSFINEDDLDLPETFKGFFLDEQTCEDDPFDLETPITEDLTLIQASFNDEAPCIQLDYIVLNGRPVAGTTLSVDVFPLGANVSISWYTSVNNRTYREIPGETESTFTVRPEDSGKFIRVYVVSDSNPPVVRYDTIKLDVFGTVDSGGGSFINTILIRTWEDLNNIRLSFSNQSKDYILMNNLDKDTEGYDTYVSGPGIDHGWVPIPVFYGSFEGNGFTIADLVVASSSAVYVGLFGQIQAFNRDIQIQNVTLSGFDVQGNQLVGSIAGLVSIYQETSWNVFIENVHVNNSTISGITKEVGGLIGTVGINDSNNGNIHINHISVSDNVSVEGTLSVGGVIGTIVNVSSINLTDITNKGTVTASEDDIGGIIGLVDDSNLNGTNLKNFGLIDGRYYVGGVIGASDYSTIELSNSFNTGNILGEKVIGGLIGGVYLSQIDLLKASNEAELAADSIAGGIIGEAEISDLDFNQVFNLGLISANAIAGGILGLLTQDENSTSNTTEFENSYNVGTVRINTSSALEYAAGGFIGTVQVTGSSANLTLNIKTSYNAGDVLNQSASVSTGAIFGEIILTNGPSLSQSFLNILFLDLANQRFEGAGLVQTTPGIFMSNLSSMSSIHLYASQWDIAEGKPSTKIWSITEGETLPWLSFQEEAPDNVQVSIFNTIQLIAEGFIPIADLDDLINISSANQRTFAFGTPYEISTKGGLNKNYVLVNNIDLSTHTSNTPPVNGMFTGSLNGNGFSLKNLTIESTSNDIGLFVAISGSTINSLTLENFELTHNSTNSTSRVGSLAAYAYGAFSIIDVNVSGGNISTIQSRAGGLIGQAFSQFGAIDGYIKNVFIDISIESTSAACACSGTGGLIGHLGGHTHNINNITLSNIVFSGELTSKNDFVGGIIGHVSDDATLYAESLINLGLIINNGSNQAAGGIIGDINKSTVTIQEAINVGLVTGSAKYMGGIIGNLSGSTSTNTVFELSNAANLGEVYSSDSQVDRGIGGIIGKTGDHVKVTLELTFNSSKVTNIQSAHESNRGAIIGRRESTLNFTFSGTGIFFNNGIDSNLESVGRISNTDSLPAEINDYSIELMQSIVTFTNSGYDIAIKNDNSNSIWLIDPNTNNGYPYLRVFKDLFED